MKVPLPPTASFPTLFTVSDCDSIPPFLYPHVLLTLLTKSQDPPSLSTPADTRLWPGKSKNNSRQFRLTGSHSCSPEPLKPKSPRQPEPSSRPSWRIGRFFFFRLQGAGSLGLRLPKLPKPQTQGLELRACVTQTSVPACQALSLLFNLMLRFPTFLRV